MAEWLPPAPTEIGRVRSHFNLTQREAGLVIGVAERTFQDHERGVSQMPVGLWELLLIRLGVIEVKRKKVEHPEWLVTLGRRAMERRAKAEERGTCGT